MTVQEIDGEQQLVTFTIEGDFQSENNPGAKNTLAFVFKDNAIERGMFIQFEDEETLQSRSLANLFNSDPPQDGTYTFVNFDDIPFEEMVYEQGALTNHNTRSVGEEGRQPACVTLWLVRTTIYTTHIDQEVELIGTFCTKSDELDGGWSSGGSLTPAQPLETPVGPQPVEYVVDKMRDDNGVRWYVKSYEQLSGVKIPGQIGGGKFTAITHSSSQAYKVAANVTGWTETNVVVKVANPLIASSQVSGKVSFSYGPDAEAHGFCTWNFKQVFP